MLRMRDLATIDSELRLLVANVQRPRRGMSREPHAPYEASGQS
jgi:hypothetical protein